MHSSHDLWQRNSPYWQDAFVQQNLILLAYTAHCGYLSQGRGLLVCEITEKIPRTINWQLEQVKFTQRFIAQNEAACHFQQINLEWEAIPDLIQAIATYDPTYEIIVSLQGNDTVEVHCLQSKTPLCTIHDQVRRRWSEFHLENPTLGN
ncbi:hypothetical protein K4A83_01315 [Spirulina subsalsa FACHB-351]|uniref:Uncharacterized protein n=1 Tax=Spirulina subsalsa FACHB-351 TaxID=234711 RepID=A0ABT3L1L0_9CYAN|nr:hypothetical protein [Spirulina subsalsa]MCW6034915.1 hypothetical protein [Spirulina subsalsa FACHB-351]